MDFEVKHLTKTTEGEITGVVKFLCQPENLTEKFSPESTTIISNKFNCKNITELRQKIDKWFK